MKVVFDGSFWGGEERGVAVSTRRLFEAMLDSPGGHDLAAFVPRACALARAHPTRTIPVAAGPLHGLERVLWQQLVLPGRLVQARADLLVATCYTAPVLSPTPFILLVHDIIALTHPGVCTGANVAHFRALLPVSLRRAKLVVVPSRAVAERVRARFPEVAPRVRVVPWGVDRELVPMHREDAARLLAARHGLAGRFVLYVGTLEPKKNLEVLWRACERLGVAVVVVGPRPREHQAGERLMRRFPAALHLGFVPAETLSALYTAAVALVMPSTIEGFGMPVVEAMHCGAPVVTSDAPVLTEVAGGAALAFASGDVGALVAALRAIMDAPGVADALVLRGRARAAALTWSRTAAAWADVLSEADA
jgi:glycosyltransferase involved in cell wall biosynthesis